MNILERELEDIIFENFKTEKGRNLLMNRGLCAIDRRLIFCGAKRQLRIGNYGTADIVSLFRPRGVRNPWPEEFEHASAPQLVVFELKTEHINLDTLLQAARYAKGIKRWIRKNKGWLPDISITLIGKNINVTSDWVYLFDIFKDLYSYVNLYKYSLKIDGIYFEKIWLDKYKLTNEGFGKKQEDIHLF